MIQMDTTMDVRDRDIKTMTVGELIAQLQCEDRSMPVVIANLDVTGPNEYLGVHELPGTVDLDADGDRVECVRLETRYEPLFVPADERHADALRKAEQEASDWVSNATNENHSMLAEVERKYGLNEGDLDHYRIDR